MADRRTMSQRFFELIFAIMCVVGRPVGGIRPRRLYDTIGRRAFPNAAFRWVTNRWGDQLYLSPSYHIDRNIIALTTGGVIHGNRSSDRNKPAAAIERVMMTAAP